MLGAKSTIKWISVVYCINLVTILQEKTVSAAQKKKITLAETRKSLPVYTYRDEFIQAVHDHQVLIIEGETGSGKTTQLPQYLYEAVCCLSLKR